MDIHKAAATSVKTAAGVKAKVGDTDGDGEQCANPGSRRWVLRLARSGARLVGRDLTLTPHPHHHPPPSPSPLTAHRSPLTTHLSPFTLTLPLHHHPKSQFRYFPSIFDILPANKNVFQHEDSEFRNEKA